MFLQYNYLIFYSLTIGFFNSKTTSRQSILYTFSPPSRHTFMN